jgi:hypothetical protein
VLGAPAESARSRILSRMSENLSGPTRFENERPVSSGAGARPRTQEVVAFIDANRDEFGVEPICAVLRSAGVSVAGHMRTTMVSFVK